MSAVLSIILNYKIGRQRCAMVKGTAKLIPNDARTGVLTAFIITNRALQVNRAL